MCRVQVQATEVQLTSKHMQVQKSSLYTESANACTTA